MARDEPTDKIDEIDIETIAPTIVRDWLTHLGYEDEQIAEAEEPRVHGDGCSLTEHGWLCVGEDEESLHPMHDVLDHEAQSVMFVLEHESLAGAFRQVVQQRDVLADAIEPYGDCRPDCDCGDHQGPRSCGCHVTGEEARTWIRDLEQQRDEAQSAGRAWAIDRLRDRQAWAKWCAERFVADGAQYIDVRQPIDAADFLAAEGEAGQ